MTAADGLLPAGLQVFERGWLSSNNVLFTGREQTAVVDTGYATHAAQTVALVDGALGGRPLDLLLNTHLHSDHCGGNAALQARHPGVRTLIPPGEAAAVKAWDEDALSYRGRPASAASAFASTGCSRRATRSCWPTSPGRSMPPRGTIRIRSSCSSPARGR